MDNQDILIRYLDKEMSDAEQVAFETELSSNEKLRSELNSLQQAKKAINLYGIQQQVAAIHKEERKAIATTAKIVRMPLYKKLVSYGVAAACIGLIFFAINYYSQPNISADKLYAEQYNRYELSSSRDNTVPATGMEKAYADKNYQEVTSLFHASPDADAKESLLAGSAYLEMNQPANAVQVFRALLLANKFEGKTSFNDEANYYLALALLKNKNYTEAIDQMEKLRADKANAYNIKFTEEYISRVRKLTSR